MAKPTALGDVIRKIAQDHGEKALLDTQFTLAVFMDLAPNLKNEKELLRSFLLCNGAAKIIGIKATSYENQKACINSLIYELEQHHWISANAARHICAEFYRGVTKTEWQFEDNDQSHSEMTANLDVYQSVTINKADKNAKLSASVDVNGTVVCVPIPESVVNGQTLCFPEKGKIDQSTGRTGNLYVTIHIHESRFTKGIVGVAMAVATVLIVVFVLILRGSAGSENEGIPQVDSYVPSQEKVTHSHFWVEASCVAPKTCSICGSTDGSALDHSWVDATLYEPQICSRCGISNGEPISRRAITAEIMSHNNTVAAGGVHTVVICGDGTAIASGDNSEGECNIETWTDLASVAAGDYHTVGLRNDGSVYATGRNDNGQCNVQHWDNITAVAAGDYHTIGLCQDGTVVATGWNDNGQCNVDVLNNYANGKQIIAVAAGYKHTVALYSDGTVYAIGHNEFNQLNVSGWEDVVAIYAGANFSVGLRSDGKVYAVGDHYDGQLNVDSWRNIQFMAVGDYFTIGIDESGTFFTAGEDREGQMNVAGWNDVVAIAAGHAHTVAITFDGHILATGQNKYGQCNIAEEAHQ